MPVMKARIGGQWVEINAAPVDFIVQEEGADLTRRNKLNFIGGRITAADDAANGRINVTIPDGLLYFYGVWTNARAWEPRDVARRFNAHWVWDGPGVDPISSVGPGKTLANWALLGGTPYMTTTERTAWTVAPNGATVYDLSLDQHFVWTGAWVSLDARHGVTVQCTGEAINSATAAYITWTSDSGDTDGYWSSGDNVTIPAGLGGVYSATCKIVASGAIVAGTACDITIQTGGPITQAYSNIIVGKMQGSCAVTLPMSAGQYFAVQVYNGSTGSLFFSGELRIWRISA